jgi:glycosyltransferase involved in cell wall biosynthesis
MRSRPVRTVNFAPEASASSHEEIVSGLTGSRATVAAHMQGPVGIVHDWLTSMRGGERVVESLCALFPQADLYTLRWDPERLSPALASRRVTVSFIDRLARAPLVGGRFRALLPLFPRAVESFRLDRYALVISSSHCVALGALVPPGALHVAYVHSTMRYVREGQESYERSVPGGTLGRRLFRAAARSLRRWDTRAGARPHVMIANSRFTRERIRRYYGRDAEVIPPPVDTGRFERAARAVAPDAPFLLVSALVPNKRVDLALQAFAGRRERLLVVGEGPDRARLERMASPNVTFLGWVADDELTALTAGCRALVHPAVEDFGMAMVEALAAGRPVIACREGGALDIITDGETGLLVAPTVEALRAALDRLPTVRFDPLRLQAAARPFDRAEFDRRLRAAIDRAWPSTWEPAAALPLAAPARLEVHP